jgi:hypothetical protein
LAIERPIRESGLWLYFQIVTFESPFHECLRFGGKGEEIAKLGKPLPLPPKSSLTFPYSLIYLTLYKTTFGARELAPAFSFSRAAISALPIQNNRNRIL